VIEREALEHRPGWQEGALPVPAALPLAAVERGAVADGNEHVLERCAPRVMGVHVARHDRGHAEHAGEVPQRCVAAHVAALVGTLELDVEALGAEGPGEVGGGVGIAHAEAAAGTAREAHEALVQLLKERGLERRLPQLRLVSRWPRACMGGGEEPAEVRVAALALDEEGDVRAAPERHLRARDRADAERLGGVGELERPVDAVVIGERERAVAELRGADDELLGLRGPVEERVGRMAVELDVRSARCSTPARDRAGPLAPLRVRELDRPAVLAHEAFRAHFRMTTR